MALYYTGTFRGTIGALNWAVSTHWRNNGSLGDTSEPSLAKALAVILQGQWDLLVKGILVSNVTLTKVITQAYDAPTGFFEYNAPVLGTLAVDGCPPFVALGFRQLRSNLDFKASTHRLPGCPEGNNANGSFVYDANITAPETAAIATWLGNDMSGALLDPVGDYNFTPVLIRTQETVTDPITHTKTTTYFTPHQISDVSAASFYGITSQVSRKFVLPAS